MDIRVDAARAAKHVLAEVWGDSLPVKAELVARALGIEVVKRGLDADVAGAIEKQGGQPARIYLEVSDHDARRNFTCAHEIGHFIRNSNEEYEFLDYRNDTSSLGIDEDERFCNEFAACLLMPEEKVRAYRDVIGDDDRQMAREFGVSRAAMVNRLKRLGLYG